MKKLKEFLKRNTDVLIVALTVMIVGYLVTVYELLKYILENGIHVAN